MKPSEATDPPGLLFNVMHKPSSSCHTKLAFNIEASHPSPPRGEGIGVRDYNEARNEIMKFDPAATIPEE